MLFVHMKYTWMQRLLRKEIYMDGAYEREEEEWEENEMSAGAK